MVWDASKDTVKVTAMVFAILIGATAFSMVFSYTGGDYLLEEWLLQLPGEKWGFIILAMLVILVLGFFIDFVEISFIIVPILAPVAEALGINMLWFAILIAMNLQTSFLTPPFGFSLFYLKGVAPPEVRTTDIYRGVLPFILLQMLVLALIIIFPEWFGMSSPTDLPRKARATAPAFRVLPLHDKTRSFSILITPPVFLSLKSGYALNAEPSRI